MPSMSLQQPAMIRWGTLLGLVAVVMAGCVTRAPSGPEAVRPAPELSPRVQVLVSDDTPAYTTVADALRGWLPGARIHNLEDNPLTAAARLQEAPDRDLVVAIGLTAAKAARRFGKRQVVFCQVHRPYEKDLVTPWMKGVSATPPAELQFRAWKELSPGLKRIGLITGPGMKVLHDEARAAARSVGVQLVSRQVADDRQFLVTLQDMEAPVQGLWLVPDSRVLSAEALQNLFSYTLRSGQQVAVFSGELLKDGGLVSMESDPADIAEQVIARLEESAADSGVPGEELRPLSRLRLKINTWLLEHFRLSAPKKFSEGIHVIY